MTKEAVPDELCDPRVEIIGDLKGKIEHVKLLDLDLTDSALFPQMHPDVFWELAPMEPEICTLYQKRSSSTYLTPPS
jgi:hypothetical protein